MINTNLILIDGISGSGKSYTAQFLAMHLQKNDSQAKWFYEHEMPHPIYQSDEVASSIEVALRQGDGKNWRNFFKKLTYWTSILFSHKARLTPHKIHKKALLNWEKLVSTLAGTEQVNLLESTFLQTTLGAMLTVEFDRKTMRNHLLQVQNLIKPLNPVFIYFYQNDVAAALRKNCDRRGPAFEEYLINLIANTPAGRKKGIKNFDELVLFFQSYKELMDFFFAELTIRKLGIENSQGDWEAYNQKISDFLSIPPLVETCNPLNPLSDLTGKYQAVKSGETLVIVTDGKKLSLDYPTKLRLFHKVDNLFCVEATLNEISFEHNEVITKLIYREPKPNASVLEFVKIG